MIQVQSQPGSELPRRRHGSRRGSIYIVTLTTTMLVAALGIAALSTARIQRRQLMEAEKSRQAQLHAYSALQLARYRMQNDASWRSRLSSNQWGGDQPIGTGFYSLTGTDPLDGDLTNGDFDPVIITATGKEGDSVHTVSAQFEFFQPGISCLQGGIHSSSDLSFLNITATSSGAPFSTNSQLKAQNSAVVTGDCSASLTISIQGGATIDGTQTVNAPSKVMPDPASLISYYQSRATAIPISSLPLWDRNYIENPGAETGTTAPWRTANCDVAISNAKSRVGASSYYIYNRMLLADGTIKQDITSKVAQNIQYTVQAYVLDPNVLGLDLYRLHIRLQTTTGTTSFTSSWTNGKYNTWVALSYTPTLAWTGDLLQAEAFIQTSLGLLPFYLDEISIQETAAAVNTYVIHRQLLSPGNNPFTGVKNSQGVYSIDCLGAKINIRDSRINGTLILLNTGSQSKIEKSMCWEPAVYLSSNPSQPNLPALIVNSALEIGLDASDLSEAVSNMNFNPSGNPYGGADDTDTIDTYPSHICGIVYSSYALTLSNYTKIRGSCIGNSSISVRDPSPEASGVEILYEPLYYLVNPPVGFRDTPSLKMVSGSVEQLVQ